MSLSVYGAREGSYKLVTEVYIKFLRLGHCALMGPRAAVVRGQEPCQPAEPGLIVRRTTTEVKSTQMV